MVDIHQEGHSQRSPEETRGAPAAHPGNLAAGTGEVIRCTAQLGRGHSPSTWSPELLRPGKGTKHLCGAPESLNLSGSDLGSARNPQPALDSSLQSNLEPEKCRPGKHTHREQGQIQCGQDTASAPHASQWLSAAFLPAQSRTEQVSLNKGPPPPPCVRAEIRHWRHLQTEEAKINRGNCFGSDRCNRLKPCS